VHVARALGLRILHCTDFVLMSLLAFCCSECLLTHLIATQDTSSGTNTMPFNAVQNASLSILVMYALDSSAIPVPHGVGHQKLGTKALCRLSVAQSLGGAIDYPFATSLNRNDHGRALGRTCDPHAAQRSFAREVSLYCGFLATINMTDDVLSRC
jgi:hypothetical protein